MNEIKELTAFFFLSYNRSKARVSSRWFVIGDFLFFGFIAKRVSLKKIIRYDLFSVFM